MKLPRPTSVRATAPRLALLALAVSLAGCDRILGEESAPPEGVQEEVAGFGACWPTHGGDVVSVSTSRAGQMLYVAEEQPTGWTKEWDNDWRNLSVVDLTTNNTRYLARTWDTNERLPVAATTEPGDTPEEGPEVIEQPAAVQIAAAGDRFVLATVQEGAQGGYRYLYHGQVPPEGDHELGPENGLTRMPTNNPIEGEFVRVFAISDDGGKVAAIVGSGGELRVFDIAADSLVLYDRVDGDVQISNELPTDGTDRTPAYATVGVVRLEWAPDGDRLAISRAEPGGKASLGILQTSTGEMVHVRSFQNSTAPHVAWSEDGTSVTVMVTPVNETGGFGNTQFLRLAAEENGAEASAGEILRPLGYRTEPALLEAVTGDQYVFVWENGLWRLTAPGGDMAAATAARSSTDSMVVVYEPLDTSSEQDLATFRVQSKAGSSFAGVRTTLSADVCPGGSGEAE